MRLRVLPAGRRDELLRFLRASSCLAVAHGDSEIEAHLLHSVSERHDRMTLVALVESWGSRNPDANVEIADQ